MSANKECKVDFFQELKYERNKERRKKINRENYVCNKSLGLYPKTKKSNSSDQSIGSNSGKRKLKGKRPRTSGMFLNVIGLFYIFYQ